ncbi:MAG: TraR/DksA C4-type zinc finger protein [Proteobacteria bacterium]|nr:TraR/DksA C4-type zinc finger protein [Pseudomonadota bacterium]MBU1583685.1 TraR/DksA C4-type zinc finger protein [Pseudomonadota bacterium]MBU2456040.1 TraR/DksA C4-type zinc finger protein [Pseudomonadota bacterium]MBU2628289.1 TraR/DksA C4-type zinc finger protein [Pseudomonadota bacterium]
MDTQQLEFFRNTLNNLLEELLNQSWKTVSELVMDQDREIESFAETSIHMSRTLNLRLRSRESHLIKKIKEALERIDDGTYGCCDICGESISIKRLTARPVTSKCIECKEMEEQMESQIS